MDTLRKKQKEMLQIKSNGTQIKNSFDGPISRQGTAEKNALLQRTDVSTETCRNKKQREN